MPLQNRVTPFGDILATPERGDFTGNRGGRIHDPATRTLLKRRWALRMWICCLLSYKDMHRDPMGQGYTNLFFLDEVTALAAGHRPCFFCRRADAVRFLALHAESEGLGAPLSAPAFDRIAHEARLTPARTKRTYIAEAAALPDGTMIAIDGTPHALVGDRVLRWTHAGYEGSLPRHGMNRAEVLTPKPFVGILSRGYRPAWHASAAAETRRDSVS